jgi:hypothetical protein
MPRWPITSVALSEKIAGKRSWPAEEGRKSANKEHHESEG